MLNLNFTPEGIMDIETTTGTSVMLLAVDFKFSTLVHFVRVGGGYGSVKEAIEAVTKYYNEGGHLLSLQAIVLEALQKGRFLSPETNVEALRTAIGGAMANSIAVPSV